MNHFSIGLLQMASHGRDQQANLAKGDAFCRRARAMGADLALFPEMWNIGYTFFKPDEPDSRAAWAAQAVGPEGAYVSHFQALARELDMAIALTYLERWPGAPRNTVSVIDRLGNIALTYAKVHTCEWDVESALTPGDDFGVCDLDAAGGGVPLQVIPAGTWQTAEPRGPFGLAACLVAPGFEFADESYMESDPAALRVLHERWPELAGFV